ncbi:glycosyltransferase family 2 protein [Vibrio breoganii]
MRYNFICVNYGGTELCLGLLSSLLDMEVELENSIRLIVVDNFHSMEERDLLTSKLFPVRDNSSGNNIEIEIIFLDENIGYFPAMNKGLELVRESDEYEVTIIGNNDLIYNSKFISNYLACNYPEKTMVISPDVVTMDGIHQNPLAVKKMSRKEILISELYSTHFYVASAMRRVKKIAKPILNFFSKNNNSTAKRPILLQSQVIQRGIGACYILTKEFFEHYEQLDDCVFMWGEEALLSNQVEQKDGVIFFEPSIKVLHHESATATKSFTRDKYEIRRQSFKKFKKYL